MTKSGEWINLTVEEFNKRSNWDKKGVALDDIPENEGDEE